MTCLIVFLLNRQTPGKESLPLFQNIPLVDELMSYCDVLYKEMLLESQ